MEVRLKKIGIISVVAVLFFLLNSAVAFAGDVFDDVQEGHWAEKSIARMKAKGIVSGKESGKYYPKDKVTREEVAVMLVRTIGKADEASGEIPVTYTYRDQVSDWAKSYIALAIKEGIIAGSDLMDKPGEAALRYEVAVLAVRAMGLADDAERRSGQSLNYNDLESIPQWARGYVEIASEEGLMSGNSDGTFAPMANVTREEIAVILDRIDKKLNANNDNTLKGEVYGLSGATTAVLVKNSSGSVLTCPVASDAYIYREGRLESYLELQSGDKLEIIKNSAGKAVYIEVIADSEFSYEQVEVEGEIEAVFFGSPIIITIKTADGSQSVYNAADDIKVTINSQASTLYSLVTGQKITAWVENDVITEIKAEDAQQIINGTITVIDYTNEIFIMEDASGIEYKIEVTEDTVLEIEGDEAEFSDFSRGQVVMVIAQGNIAERIDGRDYDWTFEGTFDEIDFSNQIITVINEETGEKEEYKLSSKVDVEKDGDDITLIDLYPGDMLEMDIENKMVKKIEASTVKKDVEGRVTEITVSALESKITVDSTDYGEVQYKIAKDARIKRDKKTIEVTEIIPGDWIEMEVEGQYAVDLDLESRSLSKYIIGDVLTIYEDEEIIIVENRDDNTKETVFVERDADIIKSGRFKDIDDIDEGDEVIIVCDPEKDFLTATIIVIVD